MTQRVGALFRQDGIRIERAAAGEFGDDARGRVKVVRRVTPDREPPLDDKVADPPGHVVGRAGRASGRPVRGVDPAGGTQRLDRGTGGDVDAVERGDLGGGRAKEIGPIDPVDPQADRLRWQWERGRAQRPHHHVVQIGSRVGRPRRRAGPLHPVTTDVRERGRAIHRPRRPPVPPVEAVEHLESQVHRHRPGHRHDGARGDVRGGSAAARGAADRREGASGVRAVGEVLVAARPLFEREVKCDGALPTVGLRLRRLAVQVVEHVEEGRLVAGQEQVRIDGPRRLRRLASGHEVLAVADPVPRPRERPRVTAGKGHPAGDRTPRGIVPATQRAHDRGHGERRDEDSRSHRDAVTDGCRWTMGRHGRPTPTCGKPAGGRQRVPRRGDADRRVIDDDRGQCHEEHGRSDRERRLRARRPHDHADEQHSAQHRQQDALGTRPLPARKRRRGEGGGQQGRRHGWHEGPCSAQPDDGGATPRRPPRWDPDDRLTQSDRPQRPACRADERPPRRRIGRQFHHLLDDERGHERRPACDAQISRRGPDRITTGVHQDHGRSRQGGDRGWRRGGRSAGRARSRPHDACPAGRGPGPHRMDRP